MVWHTYRPKKKFGHEDNRILFHRHGYYKNFTDALDQIRSHGNYQINTR